MAFDFGSDILVDAMRAADPTKSAEAAKRVQEMAFQRASAGGDRPIFSATQAAKKSQLPPNNDASVLRKFEAAVLTTFIQSMMPKEASSVYGDGLAGDMWKSKMAESIADQLSLRGGIGIADRLIKDFQMGDTNLPEAGGVRDAASPLALDNSQDRTSSFLQKLELAALLGVSKSSEADGTSPGEQG